MRNEGEVENGDDKMMGNFEACMHLFDGNIGASTNNCPRGLH